MKKSLTLEERKERFFSRVKKTDGCWEWIGSKTGFGHGRFYNGVKVVGAHRFSWALENGFENLKAGFHICHKCNNPSCVNPDHLYQGTPQQNADDCTAAGRWKGPLGEKNSNARLTVDSVRYILQHAKLKDNISQAECMIKFNVSQMCIQEVLIRRNWKHVEI